MADQEMPRGIIVRIVHLFLVSRLPVLLILFSLAVGAAAILVTPREEEPQIVVPMADVFVQVPGATPREVENLAAVPLERLLWQIDGVEHVYSSSARDMAVITVRFFVGEDRERSLVKLYNKLSMNADLVPPVVRGWIIKPVEIDDVPIVNLALYSGKYDGFQLRRVAEEVLAHLSQVKDVSRAYLVGGQGREIRVELSPERMQGMGVSLAEVEQALGATDRSVSAGSYRMDNKDWLVISDSFVRANKEVEDLVVGVFEGRPVYLRDVGTVADGPEEAKTYTRLGFSHYFRQKNGLTGPVEGYPAVTLALAKKKGTNAVRVAREVLARVDRLKEDGVLPPGVSVEVTRNYGESAQAKVDDLLSSLFLALVIVVGLLVFTMGRREALVVAVSVPVSFALALFVNWLFGYTINRVTLFALILSLGLVVDDPITNVDNIQRHILARKRGPATATLFAVHEVLPPVIMATLAIIVSFLPLFFITGMMGPYMSPMAANVPLTIFFSLVCSLTIVPWMAFHLLRRLGEGEPAGETRRDPSGAFLWIEKAYGAAVGPFLKSRALRLGLLAGILALLAGSGALVYFRQVPLKMLPFDNKNELQLVIDMPEGTSLEATSRAVQDFEEFLRAVPEVTSFVSHVGEPSPMDFNGMVRHYYLRKQPWLADIRVLLHDKKSREFQSHEIALRLRPGLAEIARKNNATLAVVEAPPGPPVLSTLVAEVYGEPDSSYEDLMAAARMVMGVMEKEEAVVDVASVMEHDRDWIDFELDKEKAALQGINAAQVAMALRTALSGSAPATVHVAGERQPLHIRVILPRVKRSGMAQLSQIPMKTASGDMVPLAEIGRFARVPHSQAIYHKDLNPVVFVYGEMAGRPPAEAVLDMKKRLKDTPLPRGTRVEWAGEGEWQITLEVFRDMGLAFAAAMLGIYLLLVAQTNSFFMPLLVLLAVPLTLIGIVPGFWLMNVFLTQPIGPYHNPVFFTATSMIGMIALGGIVIRNSIILVEFIQEALKQEVPLKTAILKSGAVRMRPILLTAATAALGAWPITLDPIFSGLAWALIFGLAASTAFTLLVVPVAFYAVNHKRLEKAAA